MPRICIAGEAVHQAIEAERSRLPKSGDYIKSVDLCAHQIDVRNRGFIEAEIVESNYGFSVRYASGLMDWGLIASSRAKQVDGTLEDAVAFAKRWCAEDPTKRYATMRE